MSSHTVHEGEKTRILMVDDHPIVREGMALFLNAQPDLDLCCEAANAEDAMAELGHVRPRAGHRGHLPATRRSAWTSSS